MKILLIEDEEAFSETLTHILMKNGYVVDRALDGETGAEMAGTGIYDIIILDRMLPRKDGMMILKEIRGNRLETPVLMLTARDTFKDCVEGLDAGADDYLTKPFATEELLARLRALSRRKSKTIGGSIITAVGLSLDPLRKVVVDGTTEIQLTVKESLLLEFLMNNCGQVLSKERIFEKVWGYYSDTEVANVDLYVYYLRKKLKSSHIKTIRGVGYCLQEKIEGS